MRKHSAQVSDFFSGRQSLWRTDTESKLAEIQTQLDEFEKTFMPPEKAAIEYYAGHYPYAAGMYPY